MTLRDVEDRIEHALFRGAFEALMLHSAFGATKKEGGPLTLADFYGRELYEIRQHTARETITPEQREEQQRRLFVAQMQVYEAQVRAARPGIIEGDPAPPSAEAPPE